MSTAQSIRHELAAIRTACDQRDNLIYQGAQAGIPKTELADLAGLTRPHIYDVIAKEETRIKEAEQAELDKLRAGEPEHRLGAVVEDRWGLRWRADLNMKTAESGWRCRSVGLHIWLSGRQLAERGPLTHIRVDHVFRGEEQLAKRRAGEAEDAAVIPKDLAENPEDENAVQ